MAADGPHGWELALEWIDSPDERAAVAGWGTLSSLLGVKDDAELDIPAGLAVGTRLPVRVKADYLVCTVEICVPESRELAVELAVGDGAIEPATRARFDGWRRALPKPLGSEATFAVADKRFRMAVPFPAGASLGACNREREAEANVDIVANTVVVDDNAAMPLDDNAALPADDNAAMADNAAANADDNSTDHGSTDHGSTDH